MTRPMDRNAKLPQRGKLDTEAGEFWVENPFLMPGGGHNLSAYERNRLFLNLGGEAFLDASFASSADIDADSRSVIASDFDRDGATDLLVASVGGGPLRLFLNRFPGRNRRLRVELVGLESNRPGIGSRIDATAAGRRIVRDVFPANGGMGQGPVELLLGVGQADKVERLTVRWPGGRVQEFKDLPVNASVRITEGLAEVEVEAGLGPRKPVPEAAPGPGA